MEYALFRPGVVLAALAGALALVLSLPASAQLRFGGSVGVVSDYVYRGYSRSRGEPAVQAGAQWSDRRWAIGAWASSVELQPRRRSGELDLFAQRRVPLTDDLDAGIGLTWYSFPGDPRAVSYDYGELSGSLDWRQRLHLELAYSPNLTLFGAYYGVQRSRESWTAELTVTQPLPWELSAFTGVGHFAVPQVRGAGYTYGSIGLSRDVGRWHAELTYFRSGDGASRLYSFGPDGGPLVASVSWHF